MSKSVIVEGLSKKFLLHHEKEQSEKKRSFFSRFGKPGGANFRTNLDEDFWALRDINFEVNHGERLAIVGKNGAGKSTLLKILSRVMSPTKGRVEIKGRLSSLLEVGTGFHPDLTGRENIFLNGALLGMSRAEVRRKFDIIVDFAEVEDFLDTPVKHYSSGMYVRLAFAVSAFLEPDIVILDEVLSVGDGGFQKKSLRRLREITSEGRTVLLVSHSMSAVRDFCTKALVIERGRSEGVIDVESAISTYETENAGSLPILSSEWTASSSTNDATKDIASLRRVRLIDTEGNLLGTEHAFTGRVWVEISIDVYRPSEDLTVGFALYDDVDSLLFWSFQVDSGGPNVQTVGINVFKVELPLHILNNGILRLKTLMGIYNQRWLVSPDDEKGLLRFEMNGKLSDSKFWMLKRPGVIAPRLDWIRENG